MAHVLARRTFHGLRVALHHQAAQSVECPPQVESALRPAHRAYHLAYHPAYRLLPALLRWPDNSPMQVRARRHAAHAQAPGVMPAGDRAPRSLRHAPSRCRATTTTAPPAPVATLGQAPRVRHQSRAPSAQYVAPSSGAATAQVRGCARCETLDVHRTLLHLHEG